jgi:hypothetical protein
MDWIAELKPSEIEARLNKDMALVYQECGLETAMLLWEKLSGLNIYVSERALFELRRLYIRRYHNAADPHKDKKALAVKLKVSEKFVQETLATTEAKDDRQAKLL